MPNTPPAVTVLNAKYGLKLDMANRDAPWGDFDSESYEGHNYLGVRDDDRQIIELVRDFFASTDVVGGRGVDVGAGPNLYPTMAMMPFCDEIDLWEYSASNVAWLNRQLPSYGRNWDSFWSVFQEVEPYRQVEDPRARLRRTARVLERSIFDLPKATWDMGTMFFVACSMSTDLAEFNHAVECFLRSLTPGAPFAAAFMVRSAGYDVGGIKFPAVSVDADDISRSMAFVAYDVATYKIDTDSPLRPGYKGMLLTTGRAGQRT